VVAAWAISVGLAASCAATAAVRDFSLLAVLVCVADEHPAAYAGAQPLQASVVRLYSVVVIVGRWVRVGCARLSRVHSYSSFLWAGSRGVAAPAGPFLYPTRSLYQFYCCLPQVILKFH
jgi:hypothetical protein